MPAPVIIPVTRPFLAYESLLRKGFQGQKLGLKHLPWTNIMPEHFDRHLYAPEYIILILASGGWLEREDWRPYVRLAIANRMKALVGSGKVLTAPFDEVQEELLRTQLYGGTFADHAALRKAVKIAMQYTQTTPQLKVLSSLVRCLLKDPQWDALLYPMWWLRAATIYTDHLVFGMSNMRHEQVRQRKILVKVLRQALPKGIS